MKTAWLKLFIFAGIGGALVFGILSDIPLFRFLRQPLKRRTERDVMAQYGADAKRRLQPYLAQAGFADFPEQLALLAFKEEQIVEVWGKQEQTWRKITTYPFTAMSGRLGPKLREGDWQIPEGLYRIEVLNPNSNYHLSLRVNYPNDFDRAMAERDGRTRLGGDIYLHGKNATVGCIPVGDAAIEELFVLVYAAGLPQVRVIIAPRDFRKNPTRPALPDVAWERLLYDMIELALEPFG